MSEFDSSLTSEDFRKLNRVMLQLEREGRKSFTVECGRGVAGRKIQDHLLMVYGTSGMIADGLLVERETRTFHRVGDYDAKTRYRVVFSLKNERHKT